MRQRANAWPLSLTHFRRPPEVAPLITQRERAFSFDIGQLRSSHGQVPNCHASKTPPCHSSSVPLRLGLPPASCHLMGSIGPSGRAEESGRATIYCLPGSGANSGRQSVRLGSGWLSELRWAQAASAAFHNSDIVAFRPPSLPVFYCPFLIFSANSIPEIVTAALSIVRTVASLHHRLPTRVCTEPFLAPSAVAFFRIAVSHDVAAAQIEAGKEASTFRREVKSGKIGDPYMLTLTDPEPMAPEQAVSHLAAAMLYVRPAQPVLVPSVAVPHSHPDRPYCSSRCTASLR